MLIRSTLFLWLIPASLCAQINSPSDEQNPVLSPDGNELYFTVGHHPQNVSGVRDLGDIWVSQWKDGRWGPPTVAAGMVNNNGYNTVLGFSADGNEMFLYGHYAANGSASGSQGISVSKRSAGGWSLPRNEEVLYFRNTSHEASGYITPDKTIFLFSADSRMTHGNEDIYVSFNENGKWTEPQNLGPAINTKFQELTPWLSEDRKTLYFSTNAHATHGSFDVHIAERLDDSWTNWSAPKNLGPNVNSGGKELYYHPFASRTFLTSTHNSDGYGDIIEFFSPLGRDNAKESILTATTQPPDTTTTTTSPIVDAGFIVYGKVLNASNNLGIPAELVFHSSETIPVSSKENGEYRIALNPKYNYTVRVEARGFIGSFEKLNISDKNVKDLEVNFKLQPVAVGAGMSLKSVLFKQSTPILLPESFDELEMVFDFLKLNPNIEIELAGHTDKAGKASLNMKLSRDRVIRVKNFLVEKGIDARRIRGVGYGETKPIASNKTEEGRRLNRRVEFKIIAVE